MWRKGFPGIIDPVLLQERKYFNGDGITDILGWAPGTSTFAYISPQLNSGAYQWVTKWSGAAGVLQPSDRHLVGNYDADNSDEIFAYDASNCSHVNFDVNSPYAPYLDGPAAVPIISDWSISPVIKPSDYLFLKTDENSEQQQLLCFRDTDAAMYGFRPNIQTLIPCATLRRANTWEDHEESSSADRESNDLTIFPNPGKGNFVITLSEAIDKASFSMSLFDIEGRELKDFKLNFTGDQSLDLVLEGFKPGVYFVRVWNNKESHFKKLVIIY